MNHPIKTEIENSFKVLLQMISCLDQEQLNTVPFERSWTAAQVGEHLLKSYGVVETLKGKTRHTQRAVDEKVQEIKALFLNFDIKMESPDFIIPSDGLINKEKLLNGLKEKTNAIASFIQRHDLSLTCLDFELPGYGPLTRLEWIHFMYYHTERHNHQLKNIIQKITMTASG